MIVNIKLQKYISHNINLDCYQLSKKVGSF